MTNILEVKCSKCGYLNKFEVHDDWDSEIVEMKFTCAKCGNLINLSDRKKVLKCLKEKIVFS